MPGSLLPLVSAVLALVLAGCASFEGARHYDRGSAALDRGEVALAIKELERAAELVPQASEIQNHLGLAYRADGRDAPALQAFERAVDLDCDTPAALATLRAAELRASARAAR